MASPASLGRKLQLREGLRIRVLNAPPDLKLDLDVGSDPRGEAVLLFVRDSAELKTHGPPFVQAAQANHLAWVAYPKAGQLGTDLNRDRLWEALKKEHLRPVRQISINEIWSALRFRPDDSAP